MSDTLSFKCPEDGCPMDISGVDAEELTDFLLVHKRVKHRKSFECTPLGMLPPEIMLKILGYVIPDCRKCFLQRDLMRLGLVCKKLNQLTKTADFYMDIKMTDECCPLPPAEAFAMMIEKSGSKMKRIGCNYRSKDLLSVALQICGDVIEEIQVGNMNVLDSLDVPTRMLEDITKLNPKSLNVIKFKSITFTISEKMREEPFYLRIHNLNIDEMDDTPQECYKPNMRKDARLGFCGGFAIHALRHIQSLQRVKVKLHANDPNGTKALFEQIILLIAYTSLSHYKLSYKEEAGQLEINVERSTEHPEFDTKPEVAFKTFLEEMSWFYC